MMRVTRRQPLSGGDWNPSSARLPFWYAWQRLLEGRLRCGRPSETAKSGFGRLDRIRRPSPERSLPPSMPPFFVAWVTLYGSYHVTRLISIGSGTSSVCFFAACAAATRFGRRAKNCSGSARAGCRLTLPKNGHWRNCARGVTPIPAPHIILAIPAPFLNM